MTMTMAWTDYDNIEYGADEGGDVELRDRISDEMWENCTAIRLECEMDDEDDDDDRMEY